MAHFDREVIPERRMHAKGSGAYGTFTATQDISLMGSETPYHIQFNNSHNERRKHYE